jgi:hypothetical protein
LIRGLTVNKHKSNKTDEKIYVRVGQEWTDLEVQVEEEAEARDWLLVVLLALALLLLGIAAAFFVLMGDQEGVAGLSDFSKLLLVLLVFRHR